MHTLTRPTFADQELSHVRTSTGAEIFLKRHPGSGRLQCLLRTGPTGADHQFPVVELALEDARLVLEFERTSQLGFIAEAVNVHDDDAIPALLANLSAEMNPGDLGSFAARLLQAVGGVAGAAEESVE